MTRGCFAGDLVLRVSISLLAVIALPVAAPGQPTRPPNVPCDVLRKLGCPDFQATLSVPQRWQAPKPGYRGLVGFKEQYAGTLDQTVAVFWFKPAYAEYSEKLQLQALAILKRLQTLPRFKNNLAVARAYWEEGGTVTVDSYVFLRVPEGEWRRNRSSKLVDQIIQANL
jgi:hypothetical protein